MFDKLLAPAPGLPSLPLPCVQHVRIVELVMGDFEYFCFFFREGRQGGRVEGGSRLARSTHLLLCGSTWAIDRASSLPFRDWRGVGRDGRWSLRPANIGYAFKFLRHYYCCRFHSTASWGFCLCRGGVLIGNISNWRQHSFAIYPRARGGRGSPPSRQQRV